jgi:hypothetical protein
VTFDWSDFFYPLTPLTVCLALFLGLTMGGVLMLANHRIGREHAFWQLAGGLVFFIPLSIARFADGSVTWERFLATFVLWVFYVIGMYAVFYVRDWFRKG